MLYLNVFVWQNLIAFFIYPYFQFTENETFYRELEERHQELVGETVEVGLLFASKAFVQLLVNPIVGPLTHRYANITIINSISIFIFLLIITELAIAYPCLLVLS